MEDNGSLNLGLSPTAALLAAILTITVKDLSRPERAGGRGRERDNKRFLEAQVWVRQMGNFLIPFRASCRALGLDPLLMRERMLRSADVLSDDAFAPEPEEVYHSGDGYNGCVQLVFHFAD